MIWKDKERSWVTAVQMDNFKRLLGIRRVERLPNARIRELCGGMKGVDKIIDESVLRRFGHTERIGNI